MLSAPFGLSSDTASPETAGKDAEAQKTQCPTPHHPQPGSLCGLSQILNPSEPQLLHLKMG